MKRVKILKLKRTSQSGKEVKKLMRNEVFFLNSPTLRRVEVEQGLKVLQGKEKLMWLMWLSHW